MKILQILKNSKLNYKRVYKDNYIYNIVSQYFKYNKVVYCIEFDSFYKDPNKYNLNNFDNYLKFIKILREHKINFFIYKVVKKTNSIIYINGLNTNNINCLYKNKVFYCQPNYYHLKK